MALVLPTSMEDICCWI